MAAKLKVTNREKFNQRVLRIDSKNLTLLREDMYGGSIIIHTVDDEVIPFHGLIYKNEFEKKYGFIVIND